MLYEIATKQIEEGLYDSRRERPGTGRIEVVRGKMENGMIEFVPQCTNLPSKRSQKETVEEVLRYGEEWEFRQI